MLVADATFYMECGHNFIIRNLTKKGAEEHRRLLFEKQNNLCTKCYEEYCTKHNKTPWWSE